MVILDDSCKIKLITNRYGGKMYKIQDNTLPEGWNN